MGDRPQKAPFFKTKLCPWYPWRRCRMGSKCNWAHSMSELRPSVDLTRTKLCETLLKIGYCDKPICRFAHSRADLRATTDVYKTALCVFWERGYCAAEASCRYAHGVEDIRDNRRTNNRAVPPIPKTVIPGEGLAYKEEGAFPSSGVGSVKNDTLGGCAKSSIKDLALLDSVFDSHRTRQLSVINDSFAFSPEPPVDETTVTSETSSPSCVESPSVAPQSHTLRTALRSSSSTIASNTDSLLPGGLALPFPLSRRCDTDAHAAHEQKDSLRSETDCRRQPLQAISTGSKTSNFSSSTIPIHNVVNGFSTHQLNTCGHLETICTEMFTHCTNRSSHFTGTHEAGDSFPLSYCPCCLSSCSEKSAAVGPIAPLVDEEHSANACTVLGSDGISTATKSSWGHLERSLEAFTQKNFSPTKLVSQAVASLASEEHTRPYDSHTCDSVSYSDAIKKELKANVHCLEFSMLSSSDPAYYRSLQHSNESKPCNDVLTNEGYTSTSLCYGKLVTSPTLSSHAAYVSHSTAAMVTSEALNDNILMETFSVGCNLLPDGRNEYGFVDKNVFQLPSAVQAGSSPRVPGCEVGGVKSPQRLKGPACPTWKDFMDILGHPYTLEGSKQQKEEEETFRTLFDFSAEKLISSKPHTQVNKPAIDVCDVTSTLFAGEHPFGWADDDPLALSVQPSSIPDGNSKDIRSIWEPLSAGVMHTETPGKLVAEGEQHPELPYFFPALQQDLLNSKTTKSDAISENAKETDFLPPVTLSGYNQFDILKVCRATRRTTISTRARTGSRSSSRDFSTTSDTSSSSAERRGLLDLVNEVQGLARNSAVPCLSGQRD